MSDLREKQWNESKAALLGFEEKTWHFTKFMKMPQQIISLFTGNQSMKTSSICYQYVMRVWGYHLVPKKNVVYFECSTRNKDDVAPHGFYKFRDEGQIVDGWERGTWNVKHLPKDGKCTFCGAPVVIHQRQSKKIRLCSETLPGDKESVSDDGTETAETKNTVYPELKKWMPPFLIKRDITFRNPAMIVADPLAGMELNGTVNKTSDIVFDFVSYSQAVQAGAGVQRMSIFMDEEPPKDFWDEQIPRLLAEDGDILLGLTPAHQMTWTFDEVFERAAVYYRTKPVVDFLNKTEKNRDYKGVETTTSEKSIGVLQAATDDNPTLSKPVIEKMFANVDDPDVLATRRYGIHRQVSGRIFKSFDFRIHVVDLEDLLVDGPYKSWNHYRMIDYHPHNKWACLWISLSAENELFIWHEWAPDPERIITRQIANEMGLISGGNRKFVFNLIDPLAEVTQSNTKTSTVDDLNTYFMELKKEGICSGGYWQTWDTKGTRGREMIRERLKNSRECKAPFNNKVRDQGIVRRLPTIWVSRGCMEMARSLKQWRLESWTRSSLNVDKDRKETPTQKFSHFCTALEAALKDKRFRPPVQVYQGGRKAPSYFQGKRMRA